MVIVTRFVKATRAFATKVLVVLTVIKKQIRVPIIHAIMEAHVGLTKEWQEDSDVSVPLYIQATFVKFIHNLVVEFLIMKKVVLYIQYLI